MMASVCGIHAGRAADGSGQATFNPWVQGSTPWRPTRPDLHVYGFEVARAFGDKHRLFLRVFDGYCAGATEAVRRALDGPDAGAYGRLRAHVLAVADATASDACLRGCLLAKGTAELAAQDPAVAARARQTFGALEKLITSCITGAQRAGDIKPDADPARLAGLLLAVLRGIEALGKGGSSPASLRAIAETALAVLPVPQGGPADAS
jgi:TetR/AcrR family transcriptional repressor of nem operon